MDITPELLLHFDSAFRDFDAFTHTLIPAATQPEVFDQILPALIEGAKTNYSELRKAFEKDAPTLAAWSCGNLLDLAVISRFVLRSKEDAVKFADNRLIDGLQIANAFRDLELMHAPQLRATSFDASIAAFKNGMKRDGIKERSYMNVADLAAEVGLADEFAKVNKVTSKFVRPTAWSLLPAPAGSERFPRASGTFLVYGVSYFALIFSALKKHHKEWDQRLSAAQPTSYSSR